MAYLTSDENEIVVDAILTKIGKQKLAAQGTLGITKFGLSDDEIDYAMYNSSNPNGSDFYDTAVSNMPILEALPANPDELKYRLFTPTNNVSPSKNVLSMTADGNQYLLGITANPAAGGALGITDHNVYTINMLISDTTTLSQDALNSIYYTGKLYAREGYGIQDVQFESDTDTGTATATQITAVGKYFIFTVKKTSAIVKPVTFGVLVQAAGPVNIEATEFTIYVQPMNAIATSIGFGTPLVIEKGDGR